MVRLTVLVAQIRPDLASGVCSRCVALLAAGVVDGCAVAPHWGLERGDHDDMRSRNGFACRVGCGWRWRIV